MDDKTKARVLARALEFEGFAIRIGHDAKLLEVAKAGAIVPDVLSAVNDHKDKDDPVAYGLTVLANRLRRGDAKTPDPAPATVLPPPLTPEQIETNRANARVHLAAARALLTKEANRA